MKTPTVKILTVGGGSGGHVSPVVAIIDRLVEQIPNCKITFWCDRGYKEQSVALMQQAAGDVKVSTVLAGKLRRYNGATFFEKITDIKTIILNILDVFLVFFGFLQSLVKLIILRPRVVFLKGGFVCLPVGYAAFLLRIPVVIHDSDTHPGLTNRLLAPIATYIATGAPLEYYRYPKHKSFYTGIPIRSNFKKASKNLVTKAKKAFDLDEDLPVVLVIGGGLGARNINNAIAQIGDILAKKASIVHITGVDLYEEVYEKTKNIKNYKTFQFVTEGYADILASADVVVSRAGASAMAEIAAVGAISILIPKKQLVGDHQTKNAKIFTELGAAELFDEDQLETQPQRLLTKIEQLLGNQEVRSEMYKKLQQVAKKNAAKDVAKLINKAYEGQNAGQK